MSVLKFGLQFMDKWKYILPTDNITKSSLSCLWKHTYIHARMTEILPECIFLHCYFFFFFNENVFSYRSPSIWTLSGSIINGVVISCLLFISQIRTVCFWRGRRNVFLRGPDCKYMLLERTSSLPSVWVRIEEIPDNPYSLLFCLCQFLVWAVQ